MSDHLLDPYHRYDSYKWSNIEFGEEIIQVESNDVHFKQLIWHPGSFTKFKVFTKYIN